MGSVVSSGALVPAVAGGLAASVMSVGADVMTPSKKGGAMATASSCAPDNFWTLLGDLVSMEVGYLF